MAKLFKVTPTRRGVEAPSLYIEGANKRDVDSQIPSRTRLAAFPSWFFPIIEIGEVKNVKKKRGEDVEIY